MLCSFLSKWNWVKNGYTVTTRYSIPWHTCICYALLIIYRSTNLYQLLRSFIYVPSFSCVSAFTYWLLSSTLIYLPWCSCTLYMTYNMYAYFYRLLFTYYKLISTSYVFMQQLEPFEIIRLELAFPTAACFLRQVQRCWLLIRDILFLYYRLLFV